MRTSAMLLGLALLGAGTLSGAPQASKPGTPTPSPAANPNAKAYVLGCKEFPFPHMRAIMKSPDAMADCPNAGTDAKGVIATDGEALQNEVKDNLCASTAPVTVTEQTFLDLQNATGDLGTPPKSRESLKQPLAKSPGIGEGKVVRYVAFIFRAKYSDTSGGEEVNCKRSGEPPNDVHIALAQTAGNVNECSTITAEMIPHYRPTAWTPENMHHLAFLDKSGDPIKEKDYHPESRPLVRITGQLINDSHHKVCKDGKALPHNPARESGWEIHPVYEIDVCTAKNAASASGCDPASNDPTIWQPMDEWIKTH